MMIVHDLDDVLRCAEHDDENEVVVVVEKVQLEPSLIAMGKMIPWLKTSC